MGSACGDGWRDEAGGEVCDDFEALDGGGCAADCSEVNAGWVCGDFATGCETEPDAPEPDAGVVDAGDSDIDEADGGTPDAGEADAALDAVSGDESDTSPTAASADDGAGCSVVPAGGAGLWALAAMGVLGFGRRRRSPAH
jgi:MYXO-CTERM domain-containing protein